MAGIPDSFKLDVTCPGCGKKSKQALARLHRDKKFRCPGCGATVPVGGDGLKKMDAAIKKLTRDLTKTINVKIKF